ncbi:hypothetical protein EG329_002517 [Mollisiaceae sp. DMI_Dod_QoI]|nr:hypothetical protein EG329_002517 [Helotiales sp. DMI_Dod_QoI]
MPSDIHSRLIIANHILHHHGILDGYGDVSIRSLGNPNNFFMAHDFPPAMVSSIEDIVEFRVDDGSPTNPDIKIERSERYIHSELYKRFPSVEGIVHSRSPDVVPYTVNGVQLKPVAHMAGFLGLDTPTWDINSTHSLLSSGTTHDMHVQDTTVGASLASAFSKSSSTAGAIYNRASSLMMGSSPPGSLIPDHVVVLMRGHGMTVIGTSLEEAVYKAIYTQDAAKAQTTALLTTAAFSGGRIDGKVDVEGGGTIKGGKMKMGGEVQFLSKEECVETWRMNKKSVSRLWKGWEWEVRNLSMYVNTQRE